MKSTAVRFASIDDYIATFSPEIQQRLEQLRAIIRSAAPDAVEKIAYHMPTFALHGNLVLFAAWRKHIGFYGTSYAILEALKDDVAAYANEKGSLLFPYAQPLPEQLIRTIVARRAAENLAQAEREPSH